MSIVLKKNSLQQRNLNNIVSREAIEYISKYDYGIGNTIIPIEEIAKIFDAGVEFEKRKHEQHYIGNKDFKYPEVDEVVVVKLVSIITTETFNLIARYNGCIFTDYRSSIFDDDDEIVAWKRI